MKTTSLLQDVLAENDFPEFRESLAARIEAEARRKRVVRHARWLAMAACIALLGTLTFMNHNPKAPQQQVVAAPEPVAPNASWLRTVPLPAGQILVTKSLGSAELSSASIPNLAFATDHAKTLPSISDSELLELFPNRARAIASTGHGARQFFFLNPADARAFTASN
jgi:hypothetical protein